MDNGIFIPNEKQTFDYTNPACGLDTKNTAYSDEKHLSVPGNSPIYASIGKKKKNPYYEPNVIVDLPPPYSTIAAEKEKEAEHDQGNAFNYLGLQKAKEIEDSIPDDNYRHLKKRGSSLNRYNPAIDDKDKLNTKNRISNDEADC